MESTDPFGHWLAGFVDGEGSFNIQRRGTCFSPVFALCLRADDGPVLEEVHRWLGAGQLYRYEPYDRQDGFDRGGRVELRIGAKADCLRLVEVFDAYPLRAKKAADYRVWRLAVLAWTGRVGHRGQAGRSPHPVQVEMAALKAELENGRRLG